MANKPLTLLQINVCNNALSTGKIASDIGELAIENGWESYIAYSEASAFKPSKNHACPLGSKFASYSHALEARLLDNSGLGLSSVAATRELISKIEAIKPSVIHLHIIHGYYLNLKVLFRYLSSKDIPVVWTIHSCWEFTGHCGFFTTVDCEKWKTGCHSCPQIHAYPTSWFRDRSRKNYEEKKTLFTSVNNMTLVPVSNWLGGLLKESFLNKYPILPIYNGIDTDVYAPSQNAAQIREKLNVGDKLIAIGVASTWEERKNLKDYIRLSEKTGDDIQIVLIGLNESQIKSLPSSIIGLPRTTSLQELVDYYSAADVVLNLSLEETFGLTTVEGFACGTPSIVYNKTASPELVSADTGFVVEADDLDGVLRNMKEIQDKTKASYSDACRKRAIKCFNKRSNYKEYIRLYNRLVEEAAENQSVSRNGGGYNLIQFVYCGEIGRAA